MWVDAELRHGQLEAWKKVKWIRELNYPSYIQSEIIQLNFHFL